MWRLRILLGIAALMAAGCGASAHTATTRITSAPTATATAPTTATSATTTSVPTTTAPEPASTALCYEQPATPGPNPRSGPLLTVPDVTGEPLDQATSELNASGFQVTAVPLRSTQHVCTVVATSPPAGTQVVKGYWVTLEVAQP